MGRYGGLAMNEYDRFILEDVIPLTEDLIEQIYETGKIVLKSAANALTWNGLSGGIDAIEALRLTRHEQNIRKLLANIDNAEDIKDFIKKANEKQKEFMTQVLIKTANLENDIQIFIMARLVQNMTNNGSLNYYESSLFSNINSFTEQDFEVYYNIWQNKKNTDYGHFYYEINENQYFYIDVQNKLFSLGILEKPNVAGGFAPEGTTEKRLKIFDGTGFSDFLFDLLREFFESH